MITTQGTRLAGLLVLAACACTACVTDHAESSVLEGAAPAGDAGLSEVGPDVQESGWVPPCTLLAACHTGDQYFADGVCPDGFECYPWTNCGGRAMCGCPAREGGASDAAPCTDQNAQVR